MNENNNINIKLKSRCKYHKDIIYFSIVLKDGRFATCSNNGSIIIYNKMTFKRDLIIKEHIGSVNCILQLSSGMLASCSFDKTIKIFDIKYNNYQLFQTINYTDSIKRINELSNKNLVSCCCDGNIIFYSKDINNNNNNKYIKNYQIKTKGITSYSVIQTKENEICYYEDFSVCFYDLIGKKIINNLYGIIMSGNCLNMITKDLLVITGRERLYVVNVNQYNLVREILAPDSYFFYVSCKLNKNTVVTGDYYGQIKLWRIDGDDLKLISTTKAHNKCLYVLKKLVDGSILSSSLDNGEFKIWQCCP